jgi:hypothetical protein
MPGNVQPEIRPQLREFLAWYEEVLGRIEAGAIVAPGEQERLTETGRQRRTIPKRPARLSA